MYGFQNWLYKVETYIDKDSSPDKFELYALSLKIKGADNRFYLTTLCHNFMAGQNNHKYNYNIYRTANLSLNGAVYSVLLLVLVPN